MCILRNICLKRFTIENVYNTTVIERVKVNHLKVPQLIVLQITQFVGTISIQQICIYKKKNK